MRDKVFSPGAMLGPYRILELIGSGGFADVYRAIDTRTNKHVALKCLKVRHHAKRQTKQKMAAEALLLTRLQHPNVVRVYEAGASSGVLWMAMELLEGRTLREALEEVRGPLSPLEALFIAAEVASGVAAANALGVVHRDLKPENVMLVDLDVKVLDMGAAKYLGWGLESTGAMPPVGTPLYMAPEHIEGKAVDFRTDVYALATITYEMCAGRHPFGPSWDEMPPRQEIPMLQIHCVPKKLAEVVPDFPEDLSEAVAKGMEKDPARRFASMREFGEALKAVGDRLLAEEEAREAQAPSDGERRSGFRSGARSVFAKAGAAALGPSSTVKARSLASMLLDQQDSVDEDAVTKEVAREASPEDAAAMLPRTAPLPSAARARRGPSAGLAATEPLLGVGPFPSPLPTTLQSPLPSASLLPSTSPLPSALPLSPPQPSREPVRFGLVAIPVLIAVGVGLTVAVSAILGVGFAPRDEEARAAPSSEGRPRIAPLAVPSVDHGGPSAAPSTEPSGGPAEVVPALEVASPAASNPPAAAKPVGSAEIVRDEMALASAPAAAPAPAKAAEEIAPKRRTLKPKLAATSAPVTPPSPAATPKKAGRIF